MSIILEVVILVICLRIALQKKRLYGAGLALTFALYIFYDLARDYNLHVTDRTLQLVLFVATVSALLSIMQLYYRNG